ncbi:alpha/beta fold hydrolase [Amycolatopsis suaedae]|nr:alpha/beta hydrolase [Amycolatopsis suaedae]
MEGPGRSGDAMLSDGRVLGWAEWGPRDGRPVLFSPGAATSRSLGFGSSVVDGLGVRLIAVDRPGLGVSTPAPGRTFAGFAADIAELSERLGLGRPAMVGNSQGAPFALACAVEGIVACLAVVAGSDEVEPAGRVDEGMFTGFDADAMYDLVMAASPPSDLAVYRQPAFTEAYLRALKEGFAQGAAAGYARDTVLAMGRWPFDLSSITVPVHLWYGEDDTTHSPDRGQTLATRIPGAVRTVVPGIGGAVLWTHAEQILAALLTELGDER